MMTLQGMADHRFTSVSLFTNVFLGEIIYLRPSLPLNAKNSYDQLHTSLERTGSWLPFQKLSMGPARQVTGNVRSGILRV